MRGPQDKEPAIFTYVSQEDRIPNDHPLRKLRRMVDPILEGMSRQFTALYSDIGRRSSGVPPAGHAHPGVVHDPE